MMLKTAQLLNRKKIYIYHVIDSESLHKTIEFKVIVKFTYIRTFLSCEVSNRSKKNFLFEKI